MVPQGDGLAPKLFQIYLNEALKELDILRKSPQGQNSENPDVELPLHIDDGEDWDFICNNSGSADEILAHAETVFLILNPDKTEITALDRSSDLTKMKKLGSLLEDRADINRQ